MPTFTCASCCQVGLSFILFFNSLVTWRLLNTYFYRKCPQTNNDRWIWSHLINMHQADHPEQGFMGFPKFLNVCVVWVFFLFKFFSLYSVKEFHSAGVSARPGLCYDIWYVTGRDLSAGIRSILKNSFCRGASSCYLFIVLSTFILLKKYYKDFSICFIRANRNWSHIICLI